MLEDVAIRGSQGAGLRSGKEGTLVLLGVVTNQFAWCGKVTLLTVGLSSDSLWMCAVAGKVVQGIEYVQEMAKMKSQTQRPVCAPGCAVSAGHASVGEVQSGLVLGHFCWTGDWTVQYQTKFLGPGPGPPGTI